MPDAIRWYDQNVSDVARHYESVVAEAFHDWLVDLLPTALAPVLDVGADLGTAEHIETHERNAHMKEWVTVLRAADAAARWHVHQRRKGSAQEPYINHLLEVASLVAEATNGKDPDLVIAALLHDAIEDQEVPRALIEREFGTRVAEVVGQVTDDKTQPKEERKMAQVKTAGKKTNDAKIIKLADKTSNMRAITFSPAPNWSVKRRLEYIGWAREVVKGLRGASPWLEQQFDHAAEEAEGSVAVRSGKL